MLKVKEIMTSEVFVLQATQTMELVRSLMKNRHIRHVPIVNDEDKFVGLLTHRDLLAQTISHLADIDEKEQEELDRNIHILNVMRTDVVTATPEMELEEAGAILLENKYGCLPVIEDSGKLVGMLTEADFLKLTLKLLQESKA